ncbi:hypothetical protein ICC18_27835 [Paenibacillus sp. WST5]|uniref:Uncharacterized protein n=1 Tax=Paenibacillus sedimenti TaxID=2770274 RepID=A0A926QLH0_9BACL|nr:hypothetical protein [Paenibacillus sedimenti]
MLLRDPKEIKKNKKVEIFKREAIIVKNILTEMLQNGSIVQKWSNGRIDLSDSEKCVQLYQSLESIIESLFNEGQINAVTKIEWLAAIEAALDAANAQKTLQMKKLLEKLRVSAKPLNNNIGYGDIIVVSEDDGDRQFAIRGKKKNLHLNEALIQQMLEYVSTEKDYFQILNILLARFIDHAKAKSLDDILYLVGVRNLHDDRDWTARELVSDPSTGTDYLHQYRNIYEALKQDPLLLKEVEEKSDSTGVLNFFNVTGDKEETELDT